MARTFLAFKADEIGQYLQSCPVARVIKAVTYHHTYRPNQSQWRGRASMEAIWRYDTQQRPERMRDIAADFYIGPDGLIWVGRPLSDRQGAHAYITRDPIPSWANGDRQWLNRHAVGIEHVGDFDGPDRVTEPQRQASLALVRALQRRFGPLRLTFHREAAYKTCPGQHFPGLDQWRAWLAAGSEPGPDLALDEVWLELDGQRLIERGRLFQNRVYLPARALEHLGYTLEWVGSNRTLHIRSGSDS